MLNIIVNALMRSRTDRLFSESCQRCEAVLTERYNVSPLSRRAETAVSADVFPTLQGNTLLDVAECGYYIRIRVVSWKFGFHLLTEVRAFIFW